ncbi:MAG: PIN domain-containing protein [Minisyncoccia bacterium]
MTLDTNILIAYFDGEPAVVDFLIKEKEAGRAIFISSITIVELMSLPVLTDAHVRRFKNFVDDLVSVPFDNDLAEVAGYLRRRYKLALPDAAIAATALTRYTPLVTRDKGFRNVTELTFVDL